MTVRYLIGVNKGWAFDEISYVPARAGTPILIECPIPFFSAGRFCSPAEALEDEDVAQLVLQAQAEWFVPLSTGVKARPTLWGRPFDGPMMGHPPLVPMELTHYDLHVWLYKPNPLGTFAPTNPEVKCTGHPYRLVEEAPALVPEPKP